MMDFDVLRKHALVATPPVAVYPMPSKRVSRSDRCRIASPLPPSEDLTLHGARLRGHEAIALADQRVKASKLLS